MKKIRSTRTTFSRNFYAGLIAVSVIAAPLLTYALGGTGFRITIEGTVKSVTLTDAQRSNGVGGTMIVTSKGQDITVTILETANIIRQDKISSHSYSPADIEISTPVRVSGTRNGVGTMTASLVIIQNYEKMASLAVHGILQAASRSALQLRLDDGTLSTYSVNNSTSVTANYTMDGAKGLTLIGKQVFITLNPRNPAQARIVQIGGNP